MGTIISLTILVCFTLTNAIAQNSWHYRPNLGLNTAGLRHDDVYFLNNNTGFMISGWGYIYKTMDGGQIWEVKYDNTVDTIGFRSIEFLEDGKTGIAGSTFSSKVLRTNDTGNTWVDISHNLADTGWWPKTICGLSHFGNSFYGVGWWGGDTARFYKSTDKGITWQTIYIDTNLATQLVDVIFISADTGFASGGIAVGFPTKRMSVILKTTDGGTSWSRVFYDTAVGGRIWKLQRINRDVFVGSVENYYTNDVCMVKSSDGGTTWNLIHTGINKQQPTQGIGFRSENEGWLGGNYSGLVATKNGGLTWDTLSFGAWFNRLFVIDSNLVYASGAALYRYGDSVTLSVTVPEALKPYHILHPVSPNPAIGRIKIEFELKEAAYVLLDVVCLDSRRSTVLAKTKLPAGRHTYYWNATHAAPGMYMVWMDTNEMAQSQKFILVK